MKKSFLLTLLINICLNASAQSAEMKSSVGISIPAVWNHSEATYYQLGSPKYPNGDAVSYGLNIDYSRTIYKGFYGKLGVGYFKQNFGIKRPFDYYPNPLLLIYSTYSYSYNNIQLSGGVGYTKNMKNKISLKGGISYSYFYSFGQNYTVNKENKVVQNNKKSFSLGEAVDLSLGITENISKKISLGIDFLTPIYTHWNKDKIFYNLQYSSDEQQIARNKFSAGIVVSCNYNF